MKTNEIIKNIAYINRMRDAGEIDEDVWRDTMESIDGELEEKLDAMEYVMEGYENDLAVLQKEEERLKEVVNNKKALENRIKNSSDSWATFWKRQERKKSRLTTTSTRCTTTKTLWTWHRVLSCLTSISVRLPILGAVPTLRHYDEQSLTVRRSMVSGYCRTTRHV